MNQNKSNPVKKPFHGCIETIPPQPVLIEFIESDRMWGFPRQQLLHFVLEENPDQHDKKTLPPDQLRLRFVSAEVVLKGWRLELMLGALVSGRLARVHAEKTLGNLILEEPWISEIHVRPMTKVDTAEVVVTAVPPSKGGHEAR